jgi:hypothetical protein
MGTIWVANFGLYYFLILGNDLQKSELLSYHQSYFWPLWPNDVEDWQQLYHIFQSLSSTLIGHTFFALLIGAIGLMMGLYELGKKQMGQLGLLLIPLLLGLLASGLGRYSLMERLSLFMMPLAGLVLARGLTFLNRQLRPWGQWILALSCLSILPLRKGLEYLFVPFQYEEMRLLLMDAAPRMGSADIIWIDHYAAPAFRWYTEYDPLPIDLVSFPATRIFNTWDGIAFEELKLPASPNSRIWLIFSHLVSEQNQQEMQQDLDAVQQHWGKPDEEVRYPGVLGFGWNL